jgi:hypothetical protein
MKAPETMQGRSPPDGERHRHGLRGALHQAVPSHFQDPVGLALRILRSGNRDARAALLQAGLRLGLWPLDAALAALGPARGAAAHDAPHRPVLFVTGPPRSGTTLLHQLMIRSLPVAYLTNLASLLPRSAAAGGFALTGAIANHRVRLDSYYGRTRALSGPSDGLEFWDRWLGPDRRRVAAAIEAAAAQDMRRFFARIETATGRPVVAKNNNLLGSAHLVADVLPTARFLCLTRDPLFLAQSLLRARCDIHGTESVSYGMEPAADAARRKTDDPFADVWRQVRVYRDLAERQVARLGPDRFHVVRYESLCADPAAALRTVARDMLGLDTSVAPIDPLRPSARQSVSDAEFARLAQARPADV